MLSFFKRAQAQPDKISKSLLRRPPAHFGNPAVFKSYWSVR